MKRSIIIYTLFIGIIFIFITSSYYYSYREIPPKTPKDENKETPKEEIKKATLTFVGDFLFEEPFYESLRLGDDENLYFSKVQKYFSNDDLSIGNMEVVIGNDSLTTSGTGYNFCAPESIGRLVTTLDLEVLSTANNHAFDRGKEGVISTIDFFKNNSDILTIGSFKEPTDRDKLNIIEKNGIKFGFLAYTMSTNVKPSEDTKYMISYYKEPTSGTITDEDKEIIKKEVTRLKEVSDVIIVLMHWGNEYTYELSPHQKELAAYLNSLGVDIIVGSHSHNIQPMEIIGENHKTLVYYSLGNFVSADNYIERTTLEFNNSYQIGLLSQLEVTLENDTVSLNNITTEPIINYYDNHIRNFMLIPASNYQDYETTHYRYQYGLNLTFINNLYERLIPEEFRK